MCVPPWIPVCRHCKCWFVDVRRGPFSFAFRSLKRRQPASCRCPVSESLPPARPPLRSRRESPRAPTSFSRFIFCLHTHTCRRENQLARVCVFVRVCTLLRIRSWLSSSSSSRISFLGAPRACFGPCLFDIRPNAIRQKKCVAKLPYTATLP